MDTVELRPLYGAIDLRPLRHALKAHLSVFAKDMTLKMPIATFQRLGLRTKVLVAREVLLGLLSVRMSPIAVHLDYYVFPPRAFFTTTRMVNA